MENRQLVIDIWMAFPSSSKLCYASLGDHRRMGEQGCALARQGLLGRAAATWPEMQNKMEAGSGAGANFGIGLGAQFAVERAQNRISGWSYCRVLQGPPGLHLFILLLSDAAPRHAIGRSSL